MRETANVREFDVSLYGVSHAELLDPAPGA